MTSRRAPRARHALAVGLSLTVVALCGAASLRLASCTPAPSSERRPTAAGELPGISPRSPALREKLAGALAAKGSSYKPRTGHLLPGGAPKYVNRLILEASPYLLQHAHNPVDWFPWGDEAFEAARREGKPVFLSVGYSTCHWCHVMERESFEDEEIAAYINQHFIAIKVDREERPDVDALYMNAVFALAGSGGWPMTILMTDDRRPFFAGTYFPARDGDRGVKRGLQSILKELAERYASDRAALVERASELSQRIQRGLEVAASGGGEVPDPAIIMEVIAQLNRSFDEKNGGFGGAPKFPRSTEIELLLRHHKKTGDARALEMAQKTLDAMAAGGIWDHLGGGFHRYATDARWRIPHFEKMLYDNAQLAATYTEAFQATGAPRYAAIARRTLDYVIREMTSPEGGFYAATDADSEGHEGTFFVWTPAEITAVVGAERAPAILRYFGVTPEGNFEGKSVLFTPRPAAEVAREFSMTEASLLDEIERSRALLYEARQKRVRPLRDDKILAAWNGLMISAMARGGFALAEPRYIEAARRAADLLLTRRAEGGRLARNVAAPVKSPGFLDDHAFFIAGLLDLHHATGETRWLDEALSLQAQLETHFWDAAAGGFFLAASDGERLFARDKPDYDGAEPSGNSVAVLNLCRMAELTSNHRYREVANKTLTAFAPPLRRSPRALPKMLAALDFCASSPLEIAIVSPPSGATADAMLAVLRASFVPNHVLVVATEGADLTQKAARIPLLEEKVARNGLPTAYVCRAGTCKQPTTDVGALSRQLAETR